MTLAEFLLARIAEDERVASDWQHQARFGRSPVTLWNGVGTGYHNLLDPARVLAECGAKRRIIDLHGRTMQPPACLTCSYDGEVETSWVDYPCPTVQLLAQPYRNHPDFDPTWDCSGR